MLRIITNNSRNTIDNNDYVHKSIVFVRKVAKTVKGGKNISFYTIAIVGDKNGTVGLGSGKARSISDAIDKAFSNASKNIIKVNKISGINFKYCASKMILREKSNTNTKAAPYIIEMFEAAGIYKVSCKQIGSKNIVNNLFCAFEGLKELSRIENIINTRNKYVKDTINNAKPN